MRFTSSWLCVWPGLPRLWLVGEWSALGIAISFGVALNLLLASSFLGMTLLPLPVRTLGWLIVGGMWVFFAVRGYRDMPQLTRPRQLDDRGLFIQAQGEYLRGHWFEAESLLEQQLQASCEDVEAHLLLATMYRRTRRLDEAHVRLDLLCHCDGAERWRSEVESERRLLQRLSREDGRNKQRNENQVKG